MINTRIGDEVFCLLMGIGEVVKVNKELDFPIKVKSTTGQLTKYSLDGKPYLEFREVQRTLFYSKPKFEIPPEPERGITINGCQVFGSIQVSKDKYSGNVLMIDIADINGVIKLHSDCFSESQWNHCVRMGILFPDTSDGWRDADICLNAYTGGRHVPF